MFGLKIKEKTKEKFTEIAMIATPIIFVITAIIGFILAPILTTIGLIALIAIGFVLTKYERYQATKDSAYQAEVAEKTDEPLTSTLPTIVFEKQQKPAKHANTNKTPNNTPRHFA